MVMAMTILSLIVCAGVVALVIRNIVRAYADWHRNGGVA